MMCFLLILYPGYHRSPLSTCQGFLFLHPSVYSGLRVVVVNRGVSSIFSDQGLQLTRPLVITAQRQLCSSLCLACYPVSLMFCQSAFYPASSFLSSPTALPPDRNIFSMCGTLFSTTWHLSNPLLVVEKGGSDADGWKA